MAFKELCDQRLQKLMDNLVFESESEDEKQLIESFLEILAKFRAVDVTDLIRETKLSRTQLDDLLERARYKKGNELVCMFRISIIRDIKPTIYLSEECGRDL